MCVCVFLLLDFLRSVVDAEAEDVVLAEKPVSQRLQHEYLRERMRWIGVRLKLQTFKNYVFSIWYSMFRLII